MSSLLLANPYFIKDDPVTRKAMDIYPLLGHGYLASYLEELGHHVDIFDATFERNADSYVDALEATKPEVAGVYGHVLSRNNAFDFARAARDQGSRLLLAGGPDATGYYDDYLNNGFDIVVRSEGEETAADVLAWYEAGARTEDLGKIGGIAYRDESGGVILNPQRPFIGDLDGLTFPRRDERVYRPYLNAWQKMHGYLSLNLIGARGCPFDCAFCYRPVFGRYYRRRSPENIVAELEQLTDRFGARHFRFVDDTFVVHKQWVNELAQLIKERVPGLKFDVLSRSDLMTDELAEDLADMGVERVYFGMESGSDEVLKRMHKGVKAEQSIKAGEIVRAHGIEFLSWIMLGYPGEEKGDIYQTRDMLVRVKPDILSISIAFPIRQTPFYDEVKDRISEKRSLWRRTGENRLVFAGRYSPLFYSFAQRWLHKEVGLAKHRYSKLTRPLHVALKWAYRAGMELLSLKKPRSEGPPQKSPAESDLIEVVG
jgi:anaerobic magnesium-protoporphyrin IX monomethyl ester cyclase